MEGCVISILRGYTYEQVKAVCDTLCQSSKVKNVEITLNTENALEIISRITKEYGHCLHIGVGTVVTHDEVKAAIAAGAAFVLSPVGYTKAMIDTCHAHNVIAIPAAFTPHEIYTQLQLGADLVKVFPANELSWTYAKKVMEPLGDLPLLAVGGVNADNVQEVLNSGYHYVGSAGGIFKKQDIISCDHEKLLASLRRFEAALDGETHAVS